MSYTFVICNVICYVWWWIGPKVKVRSLPLVACYHVSMLPVHTVTLASLALQTDVAAVLSAGGLLPPPSEETLHHGTLAVHL